MSIPLDRLYHYINNLCQTIHGDDVQLYRFYPHGTKDIQNLKKLVTPKNVYLERNLQPEIFSNDQEPLNFKL